MRNMEDYSVFEGKTEKRIKSTVREDGRRWIRNKEATHRYSIGRTKLDELAKECGAFLKIDRVVLIDTIKFERYLETFLTR